MGAGGATVFTASSEDGDAGLGDFSALEIAGTESGADTAHAAIAISPVHAMFSANPYQYSPYSPSSRLFFNVLHIDPAAVSGEEALAEAIDRLQADEAALASARERTAGLASRRMQWRLAVLRDLFDHYDIRNEGWKEFRGISYGRWRRAGRSRAL
jgi:4-alpha-glucanotransferase